MSNQIGSLKMGQKFKKTPAGEIPVDWEIEELGNLVDIKIGGTPRREVDEYWDTKLETQNHWVSIRDMRNRFISKTKERLSSLGVKKSNVKLIPKNTILMSFKLTIGRVAISDMDLYTNEAIAAFVPKGDVESIFLYYVVPRFALSEEADIAVKGNTLNKSKLQGIVLPIPPIAEQKKIAEILWSVDDLLDKDNAEIEKIKKLKNNMMCQLLTGGKRMPGSIGKWEEKKLGEIVEFSNGKAHENDISENARFVVVNSKFISTEGRIKKYSNSCLCPANAGDVVMVMSDVPDGKAIAKCFYITENNKYTVNQRICLLKTKKMTPKFLFYLLNRNSYYLSFDDGAKQTNLRKEDVLDCPLIIPPTIAEQQAIAEVLDGISAKIVVLENARDKHETIKKGLMNMLLTGKVRIR